jgi:hypothetical protein
MNRIEENEMEPFACCTPPHLLDARSADDGAGAAGGEESAARDPDADACCGGPERSSGPDIRGGRNPRAVAGEREACGPLGDGDGGSDLPVAVIGAGPVGLAAAAHLARRDLPAVVLEAGPGPGTSVRGWGHVRLFSPWELCVDPVAAEMLEERGWEPPSGCELPTGDELVDRYLEPLAELPEVRRATRYGHRVVDVTREGRDRLKGASAEERAAAPFVVRYEADGGTGHLRARAVIDASGTWTRPRPLGADGLPAVGEREAADRVRYGIPDVLGADRDRYAGARTAVVGAGHSAANVLLDLVRLGEEAPGTEPVWVLRGEAPERVFRDTEDDELAARGALERRLKELVEAGKVEAVAGFGTRAVERRDDGVVLRDRDGRALRADRVVGVTGFRPDLEMLGELRLELDPATEAPRDLGPLIDPNVHSCGTVPPHGEEELRHPEPGFYIVGMKSYGRAPTFLLPTGYEQVRSVVASLAGDHEAAARVELELPETGVCSADAALAAEAAAAPAGGRSSGGRGAAAAAGDGGLADAAPGGRVGADGRGSAGADAEVCCG